MLSPFFLKRADEIFTVSESTANDIVKYYGIKKERLTLNYNGVNTDSFTPENFLNKDISISKKIIYPLRIKNRVPREKSFLILYKLMKNCLRVIKRSMTYI